MISRRRIAGPARPAAGSLAAELEGARDLVAQLRAALSYRASRHDASEEAVLKLLGEAMQLRAERDALLAERARLDANVRQSRQVVEAARKTVDRLRAERDGYLALHVHLVRQAEGDHTPADRLHPADRERIVRNVNRTVRTIINPPNFPPDKEAPK